MSAPAPRHAVMVGATGAVGGVLAVRAPGFARVSLFRPALLVTRTPRYGMQDRVARWAVPRRTPLLPPRFHEVRVEALARAMRLDAERPSSAPVETLEYADVARLLGAAR